MLNESTYESPGEFDELLNMMVGKRIESVSSPSNLPDSVLEGIYCQLEPLSIDKHSKELFIASNQPNATQRFRFLFDYPPEDIDEMKSWIEKMNSLSDSYAYAIIDKKSGRCEGREVLQRYNPKFRTVELGHVFLGQNISRSAVSTEAIYLLLKFCFDDLNIRRVEWKCDSFNYPSRSAAKRFGFTLEGIFRNFCIYKGSSCDAYWHSIIDSDWVYLKPAYQEWLSPANFNDEGQQIRKLSDLIDESKLLVTETIKSRNDTNTEQI